MTSRGSSQTFCKGTEYQTNELNTQSRIQVCLLSNFLSEVFMMKLAKDDYFQFGRRNSSDCDKL